MKTLKVPPAFVAHERIERTVRRQALPGQMALILTGLAIGLLLMGIQLQLLSVAIDFYLSGLNNHVWPLVLATGAIFLDGLVILWIVRRQFRAPGKGTPLKER